ncbi:FAD-dependent oxidoreductase [Nonomuraea sp. NN258]|uniref:FAD-dependent monooxygenase n=1 Tax=Nonomuraea antri TaxID=2730852 RepID=UPI001568C43A|nr:FAD-dependent monooxygenase [Nonomuraea antri]NRQ34953.1 FAD-dependent oxidoreductase [Nonomuraea antri]
MRNQNILISGAGVAGPALAYWLARYGFRPTVVERAPALRPGGQAVDFRGAPQLDVLDRMGMLPTVRAAATGMGDIVIVNAAGRRLSSLPAEVFGGEVEILRGDLSRILYEASLPGTEYIFGDSITTLTETGDGVHVTFERSPTRTFDLVVGADGVRSKVRELAFPPVEPVHLGLYGAIFTVPDELGTGSQGRMYSVPGRCATIQGTRASLDFASPPLDYDHRDPAAQRALISRAFDGLGWRVPELLAAMDEAVDFYFAPACQLVLDRYAAGRVVLVGDAGYAPGPGGMGTGLGVIGAYVLAGELTSARGDHRAAFSAYETLMRPYIATCQSQAKGADKYLVPQKRSQIWTRNQMMRLLPYMPGKNMIKRMTERAASAITLKNYNDSSNLHITTPAAAHRGVPAAAHVSAHTDVHTRARTDVHARANADRRLTSTPHADSATATATANASASASATATPPRVALSGH